MAALPDDPGSGMAAPAGPGGGLAGMSPASFGMVMATGIVAIAAHLSGLAWLARALFALSLVMYVVLWLLTLLRVLRHRQRFASDLFDHLRGPGFFTVVAATSLLGSQFLLLTGDVGAGISLWTAAVVLWIALTYTFFTGLVIKPVKPPLAEGINGAWLLAVVSTQSIAALSALLATHVGQPGRLELNFLALSMWLWGGMLYIWMMSLIFYRYAFFTLEPGDLSPPYWINMGAMAISTLAGALLILNSDHAPFLQSLLPFIKGFTVFYWATGSWWIPMLLVLGLWRHVYRRFPLGYDPLYWGAVFPLGMYAASTQQMIEALDLQFLGFVPPGFLAVALVAWAATFIGLVRDVARRLKYHR